MASYTTNFSRWSDFEAVLAAAQAFHGSATYNAIESSLDSLKSVLGLTPISSTATSTSATLYYSGGVVAYAYGYNFGTPDAVINRMDIVDGTSTITLIGAVTANDTGAFTSISYTGFGYSETGAGNLPIDGSPLVMTSWSETLPTTLGNISFSATGTSTITSDIVTNDYATVTVADQAGRTVQVSGLDYSTTRAESEPANLLQMLHDMLAGNDTAYGDAAANELRTFDGNDTLDGGGGIDTMAGGAGDDVYIVSQTTTGGLNTFELSGEAGSWYLNGQTTSVAFTAGQLFFNLVDLTHDDLIDYIHITHFSNPSFSITIGANQLGQNLTTGTYANAERAPFASAGHAGLDLGFDGRGSNGLFGSFTIDAIDIDYGG
ncbi:MAG: hypothetical protein JNK59_08895, partial [Sterolibacteriaceae bacterium]|nr:hypothetical protein [Sterolibacteriaceae bacterium]